MLSRSVQCYLLCFTRVFQQSMRNVLTNVLVLGDQVGVCAALTEKLPLRLRQAEIWSMTAEDHYLRIRTESGEALILMRLSDAVAACDALEGARTHRSWWVARAATESLATDGMVITPARKALLAQYDRQLKKLVYDGERVENDYEGSQCIDQIVQLKFPSFPGFSDHVNLEDD